MSRIANNPITLPAGVEFSLADNVVKMKGGKGSLQCRLNPLVGVVRDGNELKMAANDESKSAKALAGMTRALLQNIVTGVTVGHARKLLITGVGYRVQLEGKTLVLMLGYSHPIKYPVPEGVEISAPSATEIIVQGADKQLVGQVAAELRAYRAPEPYKGKGIFYEGERIIRKEAKKT